MGTEAAWVPLVMAAVGTGAQVYNTKKTDEERDRVAAQGIRSQAAAQAEADQRLNKEVDALEQSSPEAERKAAMDQFMTQLRRTDGQATGDSGVLAGSDRFNEDMTGVQSGVQDFGKRVASTVSRISAPMRQRQNEMQGFGRAQADVNLTARNAGASDFLNRLRLSSVQRNPWVDAGGSILTGAAGGTATGGFGTTKYGATDPRAQRRVPDQMWDEQTMGVPA